MTTSKIAPISIIIFLLIFANYLYDGMWLTPKETEEYIDKYINHPFMSKKVMDHVQNGRISKSDVDVLEEYKRKVIEAKYK